MVQFVDKNQVSPRFNLVYKPFWGTVFHAGYARNFTPPPQVLGQVYQAQYFNNTTNQSAVGNFGPILPGTIDRGRCGHRPATAAAVSVGNRRRCFSKAPVAGTNCPAVGGGRRRLLQARPRSAWTTANSARPTCLTAFNYDKAENWGIEAKAKLSVRPFHRVHQLGGRVSARKYGRLQSMRCSARTSWPTSRTTGSTPIIRRR